MEPIQKKSFCGLGLLVQSKTSSWCLSFPSRLEVSCFIDKGSPDPKPDCICTHSRFSLSLPALNPGTPGICFSSLLINVLYVFFFFPELGTFVCIKNPFRQISFLLSDFLSNVWEFVWCFLAGRSFFSCYLDIFKEKPLSEIIKPSFVVIKFSSFSSFIFFYFKLSCTDFAFFSNHIRVYRCAFLIAILHPHKSYFFKVR